MTGKELEKIYNEAYRAVYWTSFSLLKDEDEAQDVVQDTFVALINSYDSIRDKSKVLPWLKKVAANRSLNRLTRTKTDTADEEFFDTVETVPEDFLPDSLAESEETRKILMDIIDKSLSEDIRRTLILFYFDEMSTREIAEALGIPEGTVSWRINSAKKKIKKEVEKYEEENDTKLYMVIPFLTKLFTREAEQVPIRPMPASLLNLSASTQAATKAAGSKLATKAITKGTGIIMKKLIIGISAVVVSAGLVTGGIVYVVNHRDGGSRSKRGGGRAEESSVAAVDQDESPESGAKASGSTENVTDDPSGSITGDRWADGSHFLLNGKEIVFYESTIQDLIDTGVSYVVWTPSKGAVSGTIDRPDSYDMDSVLTYADIGYVFVDIYPDKESAASETGGFSLYFRYPTGDETCVLRDSMITGITLRTENASAWGDKLSFDFPSTVTLDDVTANCGEADIVDGNSYTYMHDLISYWSFDFDDSGRVTKISFYGL